MQGRRPVNRGVFPFAAPGDLATPLAMLDARCNSYSRLGDPIDRPSAFPPRAIRFRGILSLSVPGNRSVRGRRPGLPGPPGSFAVGCARPDSFHSIPRGASADFAARALRRPSVFLIILVFIRIRTALPFQLIQPQIRPRPATGMGLTATSVVPDILPPRQTACFAAI